MTKKIPILALFALICWFMVSSYLHKLNISQSVTRQVLVWSHQLSNPTQAQKIAELLKTQPLITYLAYSEVTLPISISQILVPITHYGIPIGYHHLELNRSKFLLQSLSLQRFWVGNILLLLVFIVSHFIHRLKKSHKLISAQQFRAKTIAHDLKSPLTLLKALAHLNPEDSNQADLKNYIHQLENRFITILAQFQTEDDKIPFTEVSDAKIIIEDLIKQLQLSSSQAIALDWNITPMVNTQLIHCGHVTLLRLLQNVLTNALEANFSSLKKEIYIKVFSKNNYLSVQIQDEGPGLNPLTLGHSTKGEGRGLGLKYISNTLKNSPHRWAIENNPSQTGCCFTFEFSLLNLPQALPAPLASYGSDLELKWLSFWQQTFSSIRFWT